MTLQELKQQAAQLSQSDRKALRDYLDDTLDNGDERPTTHQSEIRQMLGDILLVKTIPPEPLPFDEETIMQMLDEAFRGQPPLSDEIIADREDRI